MSKITELTPDQEAELPIFRQHYLDIATTGGRIDRPALEAALTDAYAEIGKPAPRLFIFDSPAECLLAIKIFQMPEGANLWANLRDNLVDNLMGNLRDNLMANLGDNLRANLEDNLGANLVANLVANLRANLGDNLRANLEANLRANLEASLVANLRANLGDNLRANLRGNLRGNLRDNLRANLEANLVANLRANLGDNLRANLRGNLRGNLGDNLRANLEANLVANLRANLGDNLRANLRGNLMGNLGDNLWNPNFLWGSQDLYWIAWFRFAEKIGCVFTENDARRLNIMERISTQCEWWWPFEGTVFASQRPSVTRDDEGRIHRENGMAVKYRGGYGLSFWHGQVIPNEWVAGNPPTAAEALHWPNMDQRSAACEIVGWHNILDQLKARIVDDSDDPVWGRLVEVDLPGSGKERFLDALCGTGRRFALPVPPKTKTVDEAQSVLHGGLPVEILKHCVERT